MRFGIMVGGYASGITLDGFVETARDLERRGFDTLWIPHVFEHDAVTCAALVGAATERIEVGTAVVPYATPTENLLAVKQACVEA